jgi:hypothetical protein
MTSKWKCRKQFKLGIYLGKLFAWWNSLDVNSMKILDAVPAHLRWVNRQAGSQDENLKLTLQSPTLQSFECCGF